MRLMIATPAYSGKLDIPYAVSLAETVCILRSRGIVVETLIVPSGSLLVAERNRIVEQFWASECTHLLCVDGDLGWPAEAVTAMLQADKEFICGIYPARGGNGAFMFRPMYREDDPNAIVTDGRLLGMQYVPAGFMLLSRPAIEKMREKHPDLYYEPKDPRNVSDKGYCFFNTEVWNGEFWGEDFVFCRKAREAGVEIWADPLIQFNHAGTIGALIDILTTDPEKASPPPLAA